MNQELLNFTALHLIPGVGTRTVRLLMSYLGSAEQILQTPKGKLLKIPNIGEQTASAILNPKEALLEAEKQLAWAEKWNAKIISYFDEDYPLRLKNIIDPPTLLFYKGNGSLNPERSVSIVGTRKAGTYGKEITDKIIESLALNQVSIISGLAYGIDIFAHQAALEKQISTIGVMGSGLNIIYPSRHTKIAEAMLEKGGILTEYFFNTSPDPRHFPLRNRIIAGISDVVIVVEAQSEGGAMITANYANEYQREIMAVPGSIFSANSQGCHKLIKNHLAHILTDPNDILSLMGWEDNKTGMQISSKKIAQKEYKHENPDCQNILNTLVKGDKQIDDLAIETSISIHKLSSLLLELEFSGLIKTMPGKKFGVKP